LIIGTVTTSAFAGPIVYNINFTGGPPLPTSGSFTYDDTGREFFNFLVSWSGQTYDLTAAANAPFFVGNPCGGLAGAAASFSAMVGNYAGGVGVGWIAGNNPSVPRSYFGVVAGPNPPALAFSVNGAPVGDAESAVGGWLMIAAVPEPSPVLMTLIAGAFLARKWPNGLGPRAWWL
jgi:hypothetical protein